MGHFHSYLYASRPLNNSFSFSQRFLSYNCFLLFSWLSIQQNLAKLNKKTLLLTLNLKGYLLYRLRLTKSWWRARVGNYIFSAFVCVLRAIFKLNYRVFHIFGQAKFSYGGSILSSSQFTLLPQLPLRIMLVLIVVIIDLKIIISLH